MDWAPEPRRYSGSETASSMLHNRLVVRYQYQESTLGSAVLGRSLERTWVSMEGPPSTDLLSFHRSLSINWSRRTGSVLVVGS